VLKTLLYPFLILGLLILPSCSSKNSTSNETYESVFSPKVFYEEVVKSAVNCYFRYLSPDHYPDRWASKKSSEAKKYSWVEYSSLSDYYEFRLEDKTTFKNEDADEVTSTQKCIDFLNDQINTLNSYDDNDARDLQQLYRDLLSNRQSYLEQANLITALEINSSNRAKYLEIEDAKRTLNDSAEVTFFEVRELIDYYEAGTVKIFIERCPDAFSVWGRDIQTDGSILLTNIGDASQDVTFKVRYKDNDGVFTGEKLIIANVPGKSKMREILTGGIGPTTGGALFPARCIIE
jgi:hypothetical protein